MSVVVQPARDTRTSRHVGEETGLELVVRDLSGTGLVRDYLAGAPQLARFYAGFPFDPGAWQRKAAAVHARLDGAKRSRIADAYLPCTERARARLSRVLAGDGLAVTTGQQTGLFGGPLYTIYKILRAVRAAETLEALLEQPVVAVFWLAGDDHDWAEVNHAAVVDGGSELKRIALGDDADAPPVPMSARVLGPDIETAVEALVATLPPTEFAAPLIERVRSAYRPGVTMASAFRELLLGVLREVDVVLLDPAHPAVKRAASPLVLRELEQASTHGAQLAAQSERLVAAGYHAQVTIAPEAANVFLYDDQGRDRLTREEGGWMLRRTKRLLSEEEVQSLVASDPSRFSPNVLLRPVVESALIPTVAYVGGPAEVSYFAQIGCLFEAHGVEPPLVLPRLSLTIVEGRVRKVLDKFGLEPADLTRPFHEVATGVVHGELPDTVTEPLRRLREAAQAEYETLAEGAATIDPTLRNWVIGGRNTLLGQLDGAEKKMTSHLKKKSEVELEQLRKAAVNVFPGGEPQDRVLNILPYLARYGPGLLRDLAAAVGVQLDRAVPGWTGVVCDDAS